MKSYAPIILRAVFFALFLTWTADLAVYFGVREKTFWEKFWDIFAGGGAGAIVSIGAFLVIGTVGWVAGPLYGAFGIFTFFAAGAGIGLGAGGLVHVLMNSSDYVFSWIIIIPILLFGGAISWEVSKPISDYLRSLFPSNHAA